MDPGALVIGLDIGASKLLAGTVAADGAVLRSRRRPTPDSPAGILCAARQLCDALIADAPAPVRAIGIGSAGIIDAQTGAVIHANDNLPGWAGTQLRDIHALPIAADNDARAFAFGEAKLGAGRQYDSLLCVTVGTGIGGALILNGKIWHGAGFSAGELGYLVAGWADDAPLLLDQFASGPAIERNYQRHVGASQRLRLPEIAKLARQGDKQALAAIQGKARQLGMILAGAAAAFNPQALVIGGGVLDIGALYWEALVAGFRAYAPTPVQATPLLQASLGANAVMLGAGMLAWDMLET